MKKHDAIQKQLNDELDAIRFTPDLCNRVQQRAKPQKPYSLLFRRKRLLAFLLAGILCIGTVYVSDSIRIARCCYTDGKGGIQRWITNINGYRTLRRR